ncbi:MAG: DegT/DnrJ/EryC1/StrS family aminotransferase, partial [Gammaproteobacteria bacterium]|nr:DegT/DnrJ/EryC1/StrS family aminotransferase [Gammaproteobacteria bacterium]
PVFIDIDKRSYNLDAEKLSTWFHDNPAQVGNVKACIPVHLYGQCADMEAIVRICSEFGVPIIEDAAQAIGSRMEIDGAVRSAGSVGAIGCYSFFPSKNLGGLGDGGMVVTSDEELAIKLRKLKNHGSHPKYYHQMVGGNFRLDAIQAAGLLAKLPHLQGWHEARQSNADYYDQCLADIASVQTPSLCWDRSHHIYNQYVLRVEDRDGLRTALSDANIGNEIYYPVPFHLQDCFKSLGYSQGDFPQSEAAALETVAVPIYPELTREMQDYVIEKIREYYA